MQRAIHMGAGLLEATGLQATEDGTSLSSDEHTRLGVLLGSIVSEHRPRSSERAGDAGCCPLVGLRSTHRIHTDAMYSDLDDRQVLTTVSSGDCGEVSVRSAAPLERQHTVTEPWDDIAQWWVDNVRDDPRDSSDLLDLLDDLIVGTGGSTIDLGCGEGQVMRHLGPPIIGTDVSSRLLAIAASAGPVVHARLPDLGWVRPGTFDRAVCVGAIEMVEDHRRLFSEIATAVAPGGHLVAVMNHPVSTDPTSEPLVDATGDVLWRWGDYLTPGHLVQIVEEREVVLFHRPMGELLSAAASAGWQLEQLAERAPSERTIARSPEYRGQEHIPTVLGCRWVRGN